MAPEIRPLNFMSFIASSDETHVELDRTVDELSRWLAVVEGGVAGVLEKVAARLDTSLAFREV
jgi:protein-serine/threonine kinase